MLQSFRGCSLSLIYRCLILRAFVFECLGHPSGVCVGVKFGAAVTFIHQMSLADES